MSGKLIVEKYSDCLVCGTEFYGFGYAGEPCSQECDFVILEMEKGGNW
jgi:hypothetical protein